jgi:biofilm PGA synthesis N-glycosyltransferase PgaC
VIAGPDEADTLLHTMESLLGTYPRMEIVIVDDGSTDEMSEIAQRYAREHSSVLALRKPHRGGKSSALNFALPFTRAEIVVCVDGDSRVSPTAVWEVVQPFADPEVGAVSATVVARNPFDRLVTWLQALEYRRNIFLGRMFAERLGILGIISGAFGAYRRDAIQRLHGSFRDGFVPAHVRQTTWH